MMKRLTEFLLTAFAPLSWGTTYLIVTEFMPPGRPLLVGLLRALPAGLLLLAVTRQLPKGSWWWRSVLLGALNFGLFFPMLFVAAYRLPGGVASTLGGVQPLLAAGLAWVVLGERPALGTLAAGVAGSLGVGMVVLGPAARLDGIGVQAGFAATASMAAAAVLTRKWGRPASLPVFTAWQLVAGGLLLIPVTLLVEGPVPALSGRAVMGAIYLGGLGTALAYALWFRGLERIGTAASFLLLLSPLMALVLGVVVLRQTMAPVQMAGFVLVLVSVYAGQRLSAMPANRSAALEKHGETA